MTVETSAPVGAEGGRRNRRTQGIGLARLTVVAPHRRVDVAVPEQVPVAELLPLLLQHAGEELADTGQVHGGWVLRRADGAPLDAGRSLAAQSVRDGEVLHLAPGLAEWPELEYDDVVDAIATGARQQSRSWIGAATHRTGVVVAVGSLLLALGLIVSTGPPWTGPGRVSLGLAVALVAVAAALSRAGGDSYAGAAIGAVAMAFGAIGGYAVANGDAAFVHGGPAQYLAGSAMVLLVALLAYLGVGDRTQYFAAGAAVGLVGVGAALIALLTELTAVDIAALTASVVTLLAPVLPLLSIRLGKLPMPNLPATAEELLMDPPQIPRPRVYASVQRSDELLTGMLMGSALLVAVSQVVLVASGRTDAVLLVAVVAGVTLLRGRLFPTVRHRVPLLAAGLAGLATLALRSMTQDAGFRLGVMVPSLVALGGLALAAGSVGRTRRPSPYLGRLADILDTVLLIAVVPIACAVVGLYAHVRGLYG